MERDWRDERIAELEAELVAKDKLMQGELAIRDERIEQLDQQVAALMKQVAELAEKLGQNSRNSHRPPSSDSPRDRGQRKGKGKSKGKRKRCAQPGHEGSHRELLPSEKVNKFIDLFPPHCENCWKPLPKVPDPVPKRYQQTELRPIEPHTTEWRRHQVTCPCCRGARNPAAALVRWTARCTPTASWSSWPRY